MSDFEEFKEKREQWIQELCVVSQRNIRDQLSAIARDIATFKMILKAVDLAPETDREGFKKLNPLLFDMHRDGNGRIVHWFASYITLNIRKLGEDGYLEHSGNGHDRSVRSLTALLNDMKDNANLFTRENMLQAEGNLPDKEDFAARNNPLIEVNGAKPPWFSLNGEPPESLQERWTKLDMILGNGNHKHIPESTLKKITDDISKQCLKVKEWADKIAAHQATASSIGDAKTDVEKMHWETVWNTYEYLCCLARSIDSYFLNSETGIYGLSLSVEDLSELEMNPFIYLDRPIVEEDHIADLRKTWDTFAKEVENYRWSNKEIENIMAPNIIIMP